MLAVKYTPDRSRVRAPFTRTVFIGVTMHHEPLSLFFPLILVKSLVPF